VEKVCGRDLDSLDKVDSNGMDLTILDQVTMLCVGDLVGTTRVEKVLMTFVVVLVIVEQTLRQETLYTAVSPLLV
jgi:hypothetical protein